MRSIAILILLVTAQHVAAQKAVTKETSKAWADSTRKDLSQLQVRSPAELISTTDSLLAFYEGAKDACAVAEVNGYRSTSFTLLGTLDSAMVCGQRVLKGFQPDCDSTILVRGYVAMSRLYLTLGEFGHVDSICQVGLGLWRPGWEPTILRNALLTNSAIAAARSGDLRSAEADFRTILRLATEENNAQDMDDAITNLGVVKSMQDQPDSAMHYFGVALAHAKANRSNGRIAIHYSNMADMLHGQEHYRGAIALWDSALVYATVAKDLPQQILIHDRVAVDLNAIGHHEAAYVHSLLRFELNDSLLSEEKVRSLADMQVKYDSEKKAREIVTLRADKLESELGRSRLTRARNIYLFSGIGLVVFAVGLWSRLRYIHRSRAAIQHEKDISEGLLLNILPEEVAAELKAKGEAEARLIDHVTVLFTDFKGFTALSEVLSPKELVKDLHECFTAFDAIMEKHGLEKIKTIGDAYMAAGGLPVVNSTHAIDALRAALEMRDFIAEGKARKDAEGKPFFEIRIGIHTGPVVAGIVGVKKFQYDIWGDTVNTASAWNHPASRVG